MTEQPRALHGEARLAAAGAVSRPCRLTVHPDGFEIGIEGSPPIVAAYRDIDTLAVQSGTVLLVLGTGPDSVRVILERFGERLGIVVGELRTRRTRQRLADALVEIPGTQAIDLVEYRSGEAHGVGQLAIGPWGAELLPLDERLGWRRIRRAEIVGAVADPTTGTVRIEVGAPLEGGPADERPAVELLALGASANRWASTFNELRDAALRDAGTLIAALMPDAAFATRQQLGRLLVDGRPTSRDELGASATVLDAAVLTEPTFAASLQALVDRAGPHAPRWFAMAPLRPGSDERRAWYLVGLPGNLLALELVSAGAHATYLFRIVPRGQAGHADPAAVASAATTAAREVSAALIDARFLREPMALPEGQLASARYRRYRLALAALPTLARARTRFVARIVHDDPDRWAAALDDLIEWHGAVRDDAAVWPGRSVEETMIPAVAGIDEPPDPPASPTDP